MKLTLDNGILYADSLRFSYGEMPDGRTNSEFIRCEVKTAFSHEHAETLVYADGYGFIGPHADCWIRIGQVRGQDSLLKCSDTSKRLVAMVERCEDEGRPVMLEVYRANR